MRSASTRNEAGCDKGKVDLLHHPTSHSHLGSLPTISIDKDLVVGKEIVSIKRGVCELKRLDRVQRGYFSTTGVGSLCNFTRHGLVQEDAHDGVREVRVLAPGGCQYTRVDGSGLVKDRQCPRRLLLSFKRSNETF